MKEKIKSEIQRLIKAYSPIQSAEGKYKVEAYEDLLSFIESLEEEPVSNDLEEAARKIATRHSHITGDTYYANDAWFFKKGAQWQKQQDQSTIELAEDHAYLAGQEQIIDKACEFLRSHIDKQLVIYHENTWRSRDEFIEGFKKAMEE